jgi:hypothetical protein
MSEPSRSGGSLPALLLARSRALLRTRVGRLMVAFIAILYGFVSLLEGHMLVLAHTEYPSTQATVVWGWGFTSSGWWNYPALIVTAPGGTLTLPFLATITMLVVSVGVGLGMSVGLVLAYRLLRRGGRGTGSSAAVGTVSGLTPAMIALVTLGACCSTTAAATAGIGVLAQASGTNLANVLTNNWYLNVFQVAVLYVALLAQEQLLAVYGRLVRMPGLVPAVVPARPMDARFVVGAFLRVSLLAAGVTWGLASLAVWTATPAPSLSAGLAVQIVLQHLVPSGFAIAAALFAVPLYQALRDPRHRSEALALRAVALVAGLSLLAWFPAPVAGWGVFGLPNEILGAVGEPATWGAVAPPALGAVGLALRWGGQFLLLGAFAAVAAVAPERAFLPLQWTTDPSVVAARGTEPSTPTVHGGPTLAAAPSPDRAL